MDIGLDELVGQARCNGTTVGAGGTLAANGGFLRGMIASITRTGAGAYTAVLNPGVDVLESDIQVQLEGGAANGNIQYTQPDDFTLTITSWVAAVATDAPFFKLAIRKVRVAG